MNRSLIFVGLMTAASAAGAWGGYDYDLNHNYNRNSNNASASAGASAGAVGVGVSKNRNTNKNVNRNSNRNDNWNWNDMRNEQAQGQMQGQGQVQGNVGLGSGNSTSVNYEGDNIKYEAPKKPDVPAYAPDAIASPATAPCYVGWGASGGYAGLVSLGASGYVKDHGCAFGEVARRAASIGDMKTAQEATKLMYELAKKEAGIIEKSGKPVVAQPEAEYTGYTEDPFWFNN